MRAVHLEGPFHEAGYSCLCDCPEEQRQIAEVIIICQNCQQPRGYMLLLWETCFEELASYVHVVCLGQFLACVAIFQGQGPQLRSCFLSCQLQSTRALHTCVSSLAVPLEAAAVF